MGSTINVGTGLCKLLYDFGAGRPSRPWPASVQVFKVHQVFKEEPKLADLRCISLPSAEANPSKTGRSSLHCDRSVFHCSYLFVITVQVRDLSMASMATSRT